MNNKGEVRGSKRSFLGARTNSKLCIFVGKEKSLVKMMPIDIVFRLLRFTISWPIFSSVKWKKRCPVNDCCGFFHFFNFEYG